ncbi:DUF5134 domain-containing protein [Pseudarthrobacter sp. P1]|uniref:DUF5134 domain-containing protein n=1 Tax=Pseudarthrobacter sp. P1 TaxID=3418418 RepID=UPI003CFBB1F4
MTTATPLAAALAATLLVAAAWSLGRALAQGPWVARTNHLLAALMGVVLAGLPLGWTLGPGLLPLGVFTAAALWFVLQAMLHRQPWLAGTGLGVAGGVYRAAMMAATVWILAAAPGGASGGSVHELGAILTHLAGSIVLAFAGVGWLLAAFSASRGDANAAGVPRSRGVHEALMAVGLALSLFALV